MSIISLTIARVTTALCLPAVNGQGITVLSSTDKRCMIHAGMKLRAVIVNLAWRLVA
jgi:hypothetical protein